MNNLQICFTAQIGADGYVPITYQGGCSEGQVAGPQILVLRPIGSLTKEKIFIILTGGVGTSLFALGQEVNS